MRNFFQSKIWLGFTLAAWVVIAISGTYAQLQMAKISVSRDLFFEIIVLFFAAVLVLDWTVRSLNRIAPLWRRLVEKLRPFSSLIKACASVLWLLSMPVWCFIPEPVNGTMQVLFSVPHVVVAVFGIAHITSYLLIFAYIIVDFDSIKQKKEDTNHAPPESQ